MSAVQAIPFDRLELSKKNVRRVRPGKSPHKQLVASIRRHGVLQNLVVVPLNGTPDRYGVVAGARRLAAVGELVGKGEMDPAVALPCLVQAEPDATPMSLTENFQRTALHPSDEFVAFETIAKEGRAERDIARHFGISEARVRKLRRLANVVPSLITRYRKGEFSLDEIMAFAVTTDRKKQLACYRALKGRAIASEIRRHLTANSVINEDRIARFVTVRTYEDAGGACTADLFNDRLYLQDRALVLRLAQEKLEAEAEKVRAEGWKWVDTLLETSCASGNTPGKPPSPRTYRRNCRSSSMRWPRVWPASTPPIARTGTSALGRNGAP